MPLDTFLLSALLLLAVTTLFVTLFRHLGLGSVLGLLVAGMIVGPYSPGPYVTRHVDDIRHFAELGVVMLLFIIGLEMKPSRLWAMRREVFGLGSLQIVLSGIGIALALHFTSIANRWPLALLIGLTFALSSTAFVMQMLQERGEIASRHGLASFSILLMQDLAIVPLLAAVPILSDAGRLSADVPLWQQLLVVVGMFMLLWTFGRFVLPFALGHLARQGNREGLLLVVMLAVFLAAWGLNQAGLSMALGAFVMGMLLSSSTYRMQIEAAIEPYKGLLMSLFFVAVGMSIDFVSLSRQASLFLQLVTVVIVIKVAVLAVLSLAFGYTAATAVRVSLYLSQGGEFGFVLFSSAYALEVIDEQTFVLTIGVISVSMLLTPLLVRFSDFLAPRIGPSAAAGAEALALSDQGEAARRRVIIGGYGRVGHTVAVLLHTSGVPFVVFDTRPDRVAQGKQDDLPVYYGDISDPNLLHAADAGRASLVVLTIDNGPIALRALSHLRNLFPHVPVIARARDLETCGHLLSAGASHAYPEALESSLRLAAVALEMIDLPRDNVDMLLQGVRENNYSLVATDERPAKRRAPQHDPGT